MQDEFVKLMDELTNNRKDKDGGAFYRAINDYYYGPVDGLEKHESPTKRLVEHKNTTFEHKKTMNTNIDKADYSLVYVTGPNKSYVIEPHQGELNYKLAEKNPEKFYD